MEVHPSDTAEPHAWPVYDQYCTDIKIYVSCLPLEVQSFNSSTGRYSASRCADACNAWTAGMDLFTMVLDAAKIQKLGLVEDVTSSPCCFTATLSGSKFAALLSIGLPDLAMKAYK